MTKKPFYELKYTVDEIPPTTPCFFLGLQHALLIATSFIFPLILIRSTGMGNVEAAFFLSMTILAVGIGTILQSLKGQIIGSGYLCPAFAALFFVTPSSTAYALGGLGLMSAMTVMSGIFQVAISRIIRYLRFLFPPEVTGLVIIMAGISAVPFSIQSFLGMSSPGSVIGFEDLVIGCTTLAVIVVVSIWGIGSMKLYPAFIGILIGYGVAYLLGQIPISLVHTYIAFPASIYPELPFLSWKFDSSLLLPFLIASIAGVFKTIGNLTSCQMINDARWIRPDMNNYSRGTLTDGVVNIICGLLGGLGQSTSSGNIGLSLATGATSRRIGIIAGIIIIFMACIPPVSGFFLIMPLPVIGAALVYSICYMVMTGIEVMMTRLMDTRRFFTIGISLVFGLGASTFASITMPEAFTWLEMIVSSPLTLSTFVAIGLTLIFRIGITKEVRMEIRPDTADLGGMVFSYIDQHARIWGMRRDVANRAGTALFEFLEAGVVNNMFQSNPQVRLSFDEYNLDIMVDYAGDLITVPDQMPSKEELLEDPDSFMRMSLSLVRMHADTFSISRVGDHNQVDIHFDH